MRRGVTLKGIFIGVESSYFGIPEKDFILFSSPPKKLEGRIPSYNLPQLICPECGVVFRVVTDLNKTLDQRAYDFLSHKRTLRGDLRANGVNFIAPRASAPLPR